MSDLCGFLFLFLIEQETVEDATEAMATLISRTSGLFTTTFRAKRDSPPSMIL